MSDNTCVVATVLLTSSSSTAAFPLKAGVNKYTGLPEGDHDELPADERPIQMDEQLPEERFHHADMVSQHMIEAREKERQEKVR